MVYSVRSNKPIVSRTPLKTKRRKSEREKRMDAMLAHHRVSVVIDENGQAVARLVPEDA